MTHGAPRWRFAARPSAEVSNGHAERPAKKKQDPSSTVSTTNHHSRSRRGRGGGGDEPIDTAAGDKVYIDITLTCLGAVVAIWMGLTGAFGTLRELTDTAFASVVSVILGVLGTTWVLAFRYCYIRLLWKREKDKKPHLYKEYLEFEERLRSSTLSTMYVGLAETFLHALDRRYIRQKPKSSTR
jgi:hypothetical protein